MTRILVVGDIHGNVEWSKKIVHVAVNNDCQTILQVGDWGLWQGPGGLRYRNELSQCLMDNYIKLYWLPGNHECVTEDHRVVTQDGLKPIADVTKNDLVLTMNSARQAIWQYPINTISKSYNGDLYTIESPGVSIKMTADHRFISVGKGKNRIKESLIKNVSKKGGGVYTASSGIEKDYPISDLEIRLIAWCMTDSWMDNKYNYWTFTQRVSKADRIEELLNKLELQYNKIIRRDREISEICGKRVKSHEPEVNFTLTAESSRKIPWGKNLPDITFKFSERQIDIFIEELVYCDGSIPKGAIDCLVLYCSIDEKRRRIMALLTANGYRCSETEYGAGYWRINITKTDKIWVNFDRYMSKNQFSGTVYCLTMPNGNFFIERNGRIHLTGNCYDMIDQFPNRYTPTAKGFYQIDSNIFYVGKVNSWIWAGKRIAAVGGAVSIDRHLRKIHESWWTQEQLTPQEVQQAKQIGKVDYLFTHDCPQAHPFKYLVNDLESEIHRWKMTEIAKVLDPMLWFHGHMHHPAEYSSGPDCTVYGLDCDGSRMQDHVKILDLESGEVSNVIH